MLTGISSKDINFLYYSIVKDGSYFKKVQDKLEVDVSNSVLSLESWFDDI